MRSENWVLDGGESSTWSSNRVRTVAFADAVVMSPLCTVSGRAAEKVDVDVIEKVGGYEVNISSSCSADLVMSREGHTVAFLLLDSSSDHLACAGAEAWGRYA